MFHAPFGSVHLRQIAKTHLHIFLLGNEYFPISSNMINSMSINLHSIDEFISQVLWHKVVGLLLVILCKRLLFTFLSSFNGNLIDSSQYFCKFSTKNPL